MANLNRILRVAFPGGGGGGWTPEANLSPIILYRATQAKVFSDSGSTVITNGGAVQQVNDNTANAIPWVWGGSAGAKPTWKASSGYNAALPCLDFAQTSSQFLQTGAAAVALGGTTASVFCTIRLKSTAQYQRIACFIATGNTFDYDNVGSAAFIRGDSGNVLKGDRNGTTLSASSGLGTLPRNLRLISVFTGSQHILYVNGVAQGSPVSISGTFGATGIFSMDEQLSATQTPDMEVLEMGLTALAMSAGDATSYETYATSTFGS